MRTNIRHKLGWMLAAVLLATGCSVVPLEQADANHIGVLREDGNLPSMTDLEHAIRYAAAQEQWSKLDLVEPGHFVATKHADDDSWSATVDILYTTGEFSILYKDSHGMRYNPRSGKIAHNYKSIVADLRDDIRDAAERARSEDHD